MKRESHITALARRPVLAAVAAASLLRPAATAAQADTLTTKVDAIFAQVDRTSSPGCALGVLRNEAIVYARGYGMANLDHDVALSPASTFYIASTSKQFAAASILLLAQEGKLSLDDDVRKHVPELPDYGSRVTIRHLIHHTSGIRDYLVMMMTLGAGRPENVMSDDDVVRLIARQRALNFQPGTEYSYSNSGYFLLSVIVKRVAGRSLREYARERIFEPLGMRHTHFHDDRLEVVKNRVIGYAPDSGGDFQIDYYANFEGVGDGGLWTTIEDLALWDRNFYDPEVGGQQLLGQLLAPGRLANGDTLAYASGLILGQYRGLKTVSHGGGFMGYRAELLRFPDRRFSVICLCNLSTTNPVSLARKVADVYLAGEFPRGVAAADSVPAAYIDLPAEALRQWAGLYRNPTTGTVLELAERAGKLTVRASGATLELAALSPTQFRTPDAATSLEVTFEERRPGEPARFHAAPGGAARTPETFERFARASLTSARLAEYAGQYHSAELGATYTLTARGDTLFADLPNRSRQLLLPTVRDTFVLANEDLSFGSTSVSFIRDARHRVSAFVIRTPQARNIRFERVRGRRHPMP